MGFETDKSCCSMTGISLRYPEGKELANSCEDLWNIEGVCGHFLFSCPLLPFVTVILSVCVCLPVCLSVSVSV